MSLVDEVKAINKDYGLGAIGWLDEARAGMEIESIPTGSLGLDAALQVGGVPKGRLTEIFGVDASGKTTLALHLIANVQHSDGRATAFIDAEHALDPRYCENLGVDLGKLLTAQPDNGEQALEIAERLLRTGEVELIVIDSVASLVPKAEIEGKAGDSHVGLRARLMSQACRKLIQPAKEAKTAVVFINQVRSSIGGYGGLVTPGGWGLKFAASTRIKLTQTKGGKIQEGGEHVARRIQATVVKNKVGAPYREAIFDVVYGKGILRERDLLIQGSLQKLVTRSGSWYSYGDERLGQGLANCVETLQENPELANRLEGEIRERF